MKLKHAIKYIAYNENVMLIVSQVMLDTTDIRPKLLTGFTL